MTYCLYVWLNGIWCAPQKILSKIISILILALKGEKRKCTYIRRWNTKQSSTRLKWNTHKKREKATQLIPTLYGSIIFAMMMSSSSWDTESASAMSGHIMSSIKFVTLLECLSLKYEKRYQIDSNIRALSLNTDFQSNQMAYKICKNQMLYSHASSITGH